MGSDPVVLALRAALAGGESAELHKALGHRLATLGAPGEALASFEAALRLAAADREALEGAAVAAEASGEAAKAAAYRLALGSPAKPPPQKVAVDGAPAAAPRLVVGEDGAILPSAPEVSFADVGGMDDVKARLNRSFLQPLQNPAIYEKFGKRIGGGLLLYGPPGCGKTFIARALAGEIGARFVSVGLSEVLDMWFGESEKRLHELFENARRQAPTVVFFDEADALGQRRTQLKGAAGRTLVNQLLSEMDGVGARNEGLFVLGATNHPWDMDPALRRPGRFDRLQFVPPPDLEARRRILELKLEKRPVAPGLDLRAISKKTDGFSGADLQALVDAATDLAIEASLDAGKERPLDEALLARALGSLRPSTRPWFETARNYALFANEGGVYDDLLAQLRAMGLG